MLGGAGDKITGLPLRSSGVAKGASNGSQCILMDCQPPCRCSPALCCDHMYFTLLAVALHFTALCDAVCITCIELHQRIWVAKGATGSNGSRWMDGWMDGRMEASSGYINGGLYRVLKKNFQSIWRHQLINIFR